MISKLLRLYKRSHGLRQICNIAVYIAHSANTIHLLNLPEKNAKRDIIHGVKHLEEIAEGWLCARRTLGILSVLARKWQVELPEEAAAVLARTDSKFGTYKGEIASTSDLRRSSQIQMNPSQFAAHQAWQNPATIPTATGYFNTAPMPIAGSGAAAPVRSNSGSFPLPPNDAIGLQASQQPSAATTPQNQKSSRHRSKESMHTVKSGASPSDMFGGIEQLIRDSQDWAYRDQAQFATGFDNWTGLDVDPSTWNTSNMITSGAMNNGSVGGAPVSVPMTTNMLASTVPGYTANSSANTSGYSMNTWLNGTNPYNAMMNYNEDDWYQ